MTFDQIDCFIAAVRCTTFFDAAETMNITQSALSKQIIKLEGELGIKLLYRRHRTTELTDAGRSFYDTAVQLSRQYHNMMQQMQDYSGTKGNILHMGALPVMLQYRLTGSIRGFLKQFPDINVNVEETEEKELISGLADGRFDLVIARKHMYDQKKQVFYPLRRDRLMAVLPREHPLADRERIDIYELADEKFILMNTYTSIYHVCIELFKAAGIKPDIIRTARMESILSAVEVGEGVSLFAEGNLQLFCSEDVSAVPIEDAAGLTIGIIRNKEENNNAALNKFVAYMKKCAVNN